MEVFSECWYCFSVLARAAGKSRQQQFDDLYSDESEEDEELFETAALEPLPQ